MKPAARCMRTCGLFFPALTAAFLLSLAIGVSHATDPPAGSAPGGTDNAIGAVPSATDNATGAFPAAADNVTGAAPPAADNGWMDRTHSRVERDLFDTVVWFDRFFGDDQMGVTEPPESFLRWVNDFRWDEEERFSYEARFAPPWAFQGSRNDGSWSSRGTRGDPNAITPEVPGNPGLSREAGSGPVPRS